MVLIRMDAADAVKALDNVSKNLTKELRIVGKKTAKRGLSFAAKEVTKELTGTTRAQVKKEMKVSPIGPTTFSVRLKRGDRFSLKRFKPKQRPRGKSGNRSKLTGTTYKISKRLGKRTVPDAFIVHSLGGHVFKRLNQNRKSKLVKLHGPSFAGVMSRNNKAPAKVVTRQLRAEMRKQLAARIRYKTLKQSGAI